MACDVMEIYLPLQLQADLVIAQVGQSLDGRIASLHVTVAPLLIGSGRPALTLTTIQSLDHALRPRCRHFRLGEDILFDLDLRTRSHS